MSLEELEQAGILLPRKQWGKRKVRSGVARVPLVAIALLLPVAAGGIYLGDGRWPTWAGLGLFFALLAGFTWVNLRGVTRGR